MSPSALLRGSLEAAARALAAGDVRAIELTDAALAEAERARVLNAFITLDPDGARAAARASDARRAAGQNTSPLDGIPVALKDNLVTAGLRTTAASRMLADWVPPYDGTHAERLSAAGAVSIGKTNLDEFGMGSSSERSAFGPVRNPWDLGRVPGGSSGGSAAAVAARVVFGALGSDTGGSIRQPAALTGIYGLKPTYGRVSRHGLVAYASSLDTVGPLARTPADLALLFDAIAGPDPRDATCSSTPLELTRPTLPGNVRGLRLGVPRALLDAEGLDPEVRARFSEALDRARDAGAQVVDVRLDHAPAALTAYYLLAPAEAASNLARYDGVRYGLRIEGADVRAQIARTRSAGFGPEVQRRILIGTFVLSATAYEAYYARAQRVRGLVVADHARALSEAEVLALPTSPFPAFRLGERLSNPWAMVLADLFTIGPSLAGLPALNVPAGFTAAGLPVGLQLVGRAFQEARLLQLADALHARDPQRDRAPPPLSS